MVEKIKGKSRLHATALWTGLSPATGTVYPRTIVNKLTFFSRQVIKGVNAFLLLILLFNDKK